MSGAIIVFFFVICIFSLHWSGSEGPYDLPSVEQGKKKEDTHHSPVGPLGLQVISFLPIPAHSSVYKSYNNKQVCR